MKLDPKKIRKHIIQMAYRSQCGHIGPALSIVDILCRLFEKMNFNPKDPNRDYLVLSKGHGAMALYACMYEMGYLPKRDLNNYLKNGSRLHGLCESKIPGIDASTGSLGHGLPIAVGMALGLKRKGSQSKVYCIVGDGELQEGSCFEARLFAQSNELYNLHVIVDSNGYQAMGLSDEILGDSLFHVHSELTVKGSGISFMEDENAWHYKKLTEASYRAAMRELR